MTKIIQIRFNPPIYTFIGYRFIPHVGVAKPYSYIPTYKTDDKHSTGRKEDLLLVENGSKNFLKPFN